MKEKRGREGDEADRGPWPLPAHLDLPENRAVGDVLRRRPLFAHSDLADWLARNEREIGADGVHAYCPAPRAYAWEIRHTVAGHVFVVLYGQRAIAMRLPGVAGAEACADGATPDPLFGPDWVVFEAAGIERIQRWYARAWTLAGTRPNGIEPQGGLA
ncbi:MAG TPA: hypothetical protein PLW10_21005 [Myxococcota bacterium]|nr:hypothetical protein [Myxococcota bacterium]